MSEIEELRNEVEALRAEINRHHRAHEIIVRLLGGITQEELEELRGKAEALRREADQPEGGS